MSFSRRSRFRSHSQVQLRKKTFCVTSEPEFPLELEQVCKTWSLRALIDLGGHTSIIQSLYCSEPALLQALGMEASMFENYEQTEVLAALKVLHKECLSQRTCNLINESQVAISSNPLTHNLNWLAKQINLTSDEEQILLLCVLCRQNVFLSQAIESLGMLSTSKLISTVAALLDIPLPRVVKALSEDSGLIQSGLLDVDGNACFSFNEKVEMLIGFSEQIMIEQQNLYSIFASNFTVAPTAHLDLNQFPHLGEKRNYAYTYLSNVLSKKTKGVNILIYGPPGTGKTELSRALAASLGVELFEVAVESLRGDQIGGRNRLAAYRLSQRILAKRSHALLVFDEIEDIIPTNEDEFGLKRSNRSGQKGFLNRLLQENPIPTIWITNSLRPLDPAHLRRFDYCINLEIPPKNIRTSMLQESVKGLTVSSEWCARTAENEALSPALMNRAAKVAGAMFESGASSCVEVILDDVIESAMKAQSRFVPRAFSKTGSVQYQLAAVNADCNLAEVVSGLSLVGQGRICLYGPPGTGKSAFAKYVADSLGKPALIKRASDILAAYVGETERNMMHMFNQASAEGAVLILDEADSFLRSRESARRNWEVTAVNEMLTQMEAFEGVFFATTNLMDKLDPACLRRFDMKVYLDYLKLDQRLNLYRQVCQSLKLDDALEHESSLGGLDHLTPGDFSNVFRQSALRPMRSAQDLVTRLSQEEKLKQIGSTRSIGFLAMNA